MNNQYFKKLILIGMVLALCVVALGAYVRLTDAGLGCPDWPGCYGTMTVPESQAAIEKAQHAYPDKVVEVGKAWREMLHRYLAGTLGLVVLAISIMSWGLRKQHLSSEHGSAAGLTTTLLLLVIFQALLGMWTVTMLLKPVIVSAHLLGGMSTLALLTWLACRYVSQDASKHVDYPHSRLPIRIGLVILFIQIFLGGWTSTNYAALACTDFPTCHGSWWPNMDFANAFTFVRELGVHANGEPITLEALTAIQWTHRIGALITFVYLGILGISLAKYAQMSKLAIVLMVLLVIQVTLGVANLLLHLPLVLAVGHNFVAALLVMVIVAINSKVTASVA
jgi:heme a synthase